MIPVQRVLCLLAVAFAVFVCGCQQPAAPYSDIHPYRSMPFQESSIDLAQYKPVQNRLGSQDPNLAVAIAISGGGHRATNFAVGVLLELESIRNKLSANANALSEIDYFSTVSGGGLAAAAYISSLRDHIYFSSLKNQVVPEYSFSNVIDNLAGCGAETINQTDYVTDPCLKGHLERGYHEDILDGMLSFSKNTRGEYLELAFDNEILGSKWRRAKLDSIIEDTSSDASLKLGDIFVDSRDLRPVTLPYWLANATVYKNGAIFPFSPDNLKFYNICGYKHRLKEYNFDPNEQSYKEFIENVPLALGLTASGNFPVLIPATTLKSDMDADYPYLHLLDGGMADNLGFITALRLLGGDTRAKRRVLFVVDAYKGNFTPFSDNIKPPLMSNAALRAMDISLDSWRGRYRELVRALCSSNSYGPDIKTVFVSFDDLKELNGFDELIEFGFSVDDLNQLKADGLMDNITPTPFNLVRTVKTQFNLTPAQQSLLFAAGRYVINKKRDQIIQSLSW